MHVSYVHVMTFQNAKIILGRCEFYVLQIFVPIVLDMLSLLRSSYKNSI